VSRRDLLGKAGAVAAAGVAGAVVGGGLVAQPVAAETGESLVLGNPNVSGLETSLRIGKEHPGVSR